MSEMNYDPCERYKESIKELIPEKEEEPKSYADIVAKLQYEIAKEYRIKYMKEVYIVISKDSFRIDSVWDRFSDAYLRLWDLKNTNEEYDIEARTVYSRR